MDISKYYTINDDDTIHIKDDTPEEVLYELSQCDDWDECYDWKMKKAIASHPNVGYETLYMLMEYAATIWDSFFDYRCLYWEDVFDDSDVCGANETLQAIACNPNTADDLLRQLAKLEDMRCNKGFLLEAASNPNAPLGVLAAAAEEDQSFLRKTIIKALTELSDSGNEEDRTAARKALEAFTD